MMDVKKFTWKCLLISTTVAGLLATQPRSYAGSDAEDTAVAGPSAAVEAVVFADVIEDWIKEHAHKKAERYVSHFLEKNNIDEDRKTGALFVTLSRAEQHGQSLPPELAQITETGLMSYLLNTLRADKSIWTGVALMAAIASRNGRGDIDFERKDEFAIALYEQMLSSTNFATWSQAVTGLIQMAGQDKMTFVDDAAKADYVRQRKVEIFEHQKTSIATKAGAALNIAMILLRDIIEKRKNDLPELPQDAKFPDFKPFESEEDNAKTKQAVEYLKGIIHRDSEADEGPDNWGGPVHLEKYLSAAETLGMLLRFGMIDDTEENRLKLYKSLDGIDITGDILKELEEKEKLQAVTKQPMSDLAKIWLNRARAAKAQKDAKAQAADTHKGDEKDKEKA